MYQDIRKSPVNNRPDRAFRCDCGPVHLAATVAITEERSNTGAASSDVANAQQKTAESFLADSRVHCMRIVAAGSCQPKLVMGMPFTNVMKAIAFFQGLANPDQVINVLVEESALVIGPRAGADDIHNNGISRGCPVSKELSAGLNVGVLHDAAGQVIQFRTEDDHLASVVGPFHDGLVITVAPDFKHPHQVLTSGVELFLLHFRCFH